MSIKIVYYVLPSVWKIFEYATAFKSVIRLYLICSRCMVREHVFIGLRYKAQFLSKGFCSFSNKQAVRTPIHHFACYTTWLCNTNNEKMVINKKTFTLGFRQRYCSTMKKYTLFYICLFCVPSQCSHCPKSSW